MRFLFVMLFSVVVARWGYAEIELNFPSALPMVDKTLEMVAIPTHDQWGDSKLAEALAILRDSQGSAENKLMAKINPTEIKEDLDKEAMQELLGELAFKDSVATKF